MERQQTDMLAAPNKNNIDCQNHNVLRHTFSVTAIQKGISIRSMQEVLDHNHLATTEIYLNLFPEDVMREFRDKW
jgi:integrase/recombinase XerD